MDKNLKKVEKPLFYTMFNPPPSVPEKNDGSSITNPDPGMSLREMVERYVSHGETPLGKEVYYDDDENNMIPNGGVTLADISEAKDAAEAASNEVKEIEEKISKKKSKENKDNELAVKQLQDKKSEAGARTKKASEGNGDAHDDKGGTTAEEAS